MSKSPATAQPSYPAQGIGVAHALARQPEPERYNLKWGRLIGRLSASAVAEYTDNLDLASRHPSDDFSFGPNVGLGLFWPLSQANTLEVDFSAGYRWFINHPNIQTVNVAPNSFLDYRVLFEHGQISLHDRFSVLVDPTSRPDVSGQSSSDDVTNFRRFDNALGGAVEWRPVQRWSLEGGYDYGLNRSLTGEFTSIDRDSHALHAGTYYNFSPRFQAGVSGTTTFTDYTKEVQNNATAYSLGPVLILQPTRFITVDLRGGYAVTTFDNTGTIADTTEFRGFTGFAGIRHRLNRWMSHEVRINKSVELGLSSNYYDLLGVQYGFNARLNRITSARVGTRYEHYTASGPGGETADRVSLDLGLQWQVAKQWQLGAGYTFNLKASDQSGNDYTQNRFSLNLTRQF